MTRQIGPTLQHLPGRRPVRPLALGGHLVDAAPGLAGGAYGDGIAQCLAVAEHEIEPPLRRADHNGARLLIGGIADNPARDVGPKQAAEKRATANVLVVGMSRGRRGGSGNAQQGDEPSRYDCDDLHDANPLVLGTRTGWPSDAPIPLCLGKTPASPIPPSGSTPPAMPPPPFFPSTPP